MAAQEIDSILQKYIDPSTGSIHGATFVAVNRTGKTPLELAKSRLLRSID
jgi:hypothetical protein